MIHALLLLGLTALVGEPGFGFGLLLKAPGNCLQMDHGEEVCSQA